MEAVGRFKDLIAIAVAAVAVVLSLITVIIQRRQQQRDAGSVCDVVDQLRGMVPKR